MAFVKPDHSWKRFGVAFFLRTCDITVRSANTRPHLLRARLVSIASRLCSLMLLNPNQTASEYSRHRYHTIPLPQTRLDSFPHEQRLHNIFLGDTRYEAYRTSPVPDSWHDQNTYVLGITYVESGIAGVKKPLAGCTCNYCNTKRHQLGLLARNRLAHLRSAFQLCAHCLVGQECMHSQTALRRSLNAEACLRRNMQPIGKI